MGDIDRPPYNRPLYRGSIKHKARPGRGRKGTICPEWTHETPSGGLGNKVEDHDWPSTVAHHLFGQALADESRAGRVFATERGVAFEAKSSNDGTWHGYPVPWNVVPAALKERWRDEGRVTRAQLKRYLARPTTDIKWALETDHDD